MKAKDIMSAPVVFIGPDTPVRDIATLLLRRHISGVLVVENGQVVGVVNEGDLLRRFEIGTDSSGPQQSWWSQLIGRRTLPGDYVKSHARHARDVMTSPVTTVTEETTIQEVASIFAARHIRRIPVLRRNELLGIVTRADLVRAIALKTRAAEAPRAQSDEAIRTQLLEELEAQRWWRPGWSTLDVHDGVVHFAGLIDSEDTRLATRIAAENVPGVRGVEDERMQTSSFQPMF